MSVEFNPHQLKQIADARPRAVEFFEAMSLEKVRELKSLVMPFDADMSLGLYSMSPDIRYRRRKG